VIEHSGGGSTTALGRGTVVVSGLFR